MGDLILQTARQTSVTWAKEGQLLCIPSEVETSASGENKHELYVAPVYRWQIKPPASGDARTSGSVEWRRCVRGVTQLFSHIVILPASHAFCDLVFN